MDQHFRLVGSNIKRNAQQSHSVSFTICVRFQQKCQWVMITTVRSKVIFGEAKLWNYARCASKSWGRFNCNSECWEV